MKLPQQELLEQFLMEDLPSMSEMRYSATHEPAVAMDVARDMVSWTEINEMVIQKSTATGANLHLWRSASLAINACNRMRLVVESLRALDEKTANQTVTEINSLFPLPLFDEAMRAQLPNCSTTEKRHGRLVITGTSSLPTLVPSFCRTNSGKFQVIFESVEPVEQGNESQIADYLIALVAGITPNIGSGGGREIPYLQNPTPGTVGAENAILTIMTFIARISPDDWIQDYVGQDDWLQELNEPDQFTLDDLLDVVGSSNSETGFVPNLDQAAQSRVNNPSTPDTTTSVHPLMDSHMEGIQHSPTMSVHPLAHGPMDSVEHSPVRIISYAPYQTASERWEGDNSGWPNQERHRKSDSEPQIPVRKYQECQNWNDLISHMSNHITAEIEKIDQSSFPGREKLKFMEQEAYSTSSTLGKSVRKFKESLEKFRKDIRIVIDKFSNAGPQRLHRAVSTAIDNFERGSVNTLVGETERLSKKLDTLAKGIRFRELTSSKIAQTCASSLKVLVESFLAEQKSNFFPVADLAKWYPKNCPVVR